MEVVSVRVLKDDGSNTKMVSTDFLRQYRQALENMIRESESWVWHSNADRRELSVELLQDSTVRIHDHTYTSNCVLGISREDVILGITWHVKFGPQTHYKSRKVKVRGQTLQALIPSKRESGIPKVQPTSIQKFGSVWRTEVTSKSSTWRQRHWK